MEHSVVDPARRIDEIHILLNFNTRSTACVKNRFTVNRKGIADCKNYAYSLKQYTICLYVSRLFSFASVLRKSHTQTP